MNTNPFSDETTIKIKSRKNPMGEYAQLSTPDLLHAVKKSANSSHRADLDMLLDQVKIYSFVLLSDSFITALMEVVALHP